MSSVFDPPVLDSPVSDPSASDVAAFTAAGEFDMANAESLGAELDRAIERTDGTLVIDLLDVTYLDSTALSVLLSAHEHLSAVGRTLRVGRASATVERLFEVCGVASLLMPEVQRR